MKMFSRESGDNETTSTNKEGIEEQCPESAGDGLKREESMEEKVDEVSRVTNLKKRLSFKAIKSRFTKEKKEEEVAPPEGGNEGTGEKAEVEEEVKSGEDERKEDTKDEVFVHSIGKRVLVIRRMTRTRARTLSGVCWRTWRVFATRGSSLRAIRRPR